MAQFCGKCGAEVPVGDGFCPKCGAMVSIGGSTGAVNPAGMTGVQQPAAGGRPMAYGAQQPGAGGQTVYGAGEKKKLSYGVISLILLFGGPILCGLGVGLFSEILESEGLASIFLILFWISPLVAAILAIMGLSMQKDRPKAPAIITLVLVGIAIFIGIILLAFGAGYAGGYDVPWYQKL